MSENKTLCHPASVDSLSTSAGTEDHVSMGGFAARKALRVVRNVEKVNLRASQNFWGYLPHSGLSSEWPGATLVGVSEG